mmetsp:Transcript_24571/g.24811  ORF Transcript_24571/g.24811 Transcript_24571/m.24811 type:complete len:500 (-) Transcript_24571:130-1629(-)|eukprot:CAMPEP_0182435760 /NCGR_PEP_ID=MMETSP1167-20130531/77465_1 /TAXON_ID=2988 /ORGANISM="Mallomonas Sp, Strain CCMP3275" /LENGTH=499 /DNA_ID=CAMNT_0024627159 /DNA_START=120 /DNA_END=1622 /DNA_ORIENTATION=-
MKSFNSQEGSSSSLKSGERTPISGGFWKANLLAERVLSHLGFTFDVQDEVTGDISESQIDFQLQVTKAYLFEEQIKDFCSSARNHFNYAKSLTFLTEEDDQLKEFADALTNSAYLDVLDRALRELLEMPFELLRLHIRKIEEVMELRDGLLQEYHHQKAKRDGGHPKSMEDSTKLDSAIDAVKENTQWLQVHFLAFKNTYPQLRKRIAGGVAAVHIIQSHLLVSNIESTSLSKDTLVLHYLAELKQYNVIVQTGNEMPDLIFPSNLREYRQAMQAAWTTVRGVFGRDLVEFDAIPDIVTKSISFLQAHGLLTEGIFRVPGDDDRVRELRQEFDQGHDVNLMLCESDEEVADAVQCFPQDVASLLKLFFRSLPQPLIPSTCFHDLLDASTTPVKEFNSTVSTILHSSLYPAVNKSCLQILLGLLVQVSQISDINRMSADNLAVVFAPTIMRCPETELPQLKDTQRTITFCKRLIQSAEEIIGESFWEGYPKSEPYVAHDG